MVSRVQKSARRRDLLVRLTLLALAVGVGYLVFEFGRIRAGYDIVEAGREQDALQQEIAALEAKNLALKEEIALLETHRDIDREAYAEVEKNLVSLQGKIQEQQDAIAFYRGIVSPADGNSGLRVQDFRLTRGAEERAYNIRLVLIQAMKHDRKVSGAVRLSVAGMEDGVEKSYPYSELLPPDGDSRWPFSFRYFQDFDKPLVLPDGFTPERVDVVVESRTKAISSIEESFEWLSSQG
jgi:cell division protein FtsB